MVPASPTSVAPHENGLILHASGAGWLMVEKPSGMSIHNTPGKDLLSLVPELLSDKAVARQVQADPDFGIHPVHRLDQETSGLVLIGTQADAHRKLSRQFESRGVEKRYLALVHGSLPEDSGHWDTPLTNRAEGRKHPAGSGKRVPCHTQWQVLDRTAHYTLLSIRLHTGRKHQIRRHAVLHRHAVVGDRRYGPKRALDYLMERVPDLRLGLHAHELVFTPPDGDGPIRIRSNGLPDALSALMAADRD